jgi:hypothetical protein
MVEFNENRENSMNEYVEYNPQNLENILLKVEQLNKYIAHLESSLKAAENKKDSYKNILMKYKEILDEQLKLYQLHRSNMYMLNETMKENEVFMLELEQEFLSYVNSQSENTDKNEKSLSFKRIMLRFIQQNKMSKLQLKEKLTELNETIEQKNRLIERMQNEVKISSDSDDASSLPSQRVSLN